MFTKQMDIEFKAKGITNVKVCSLCPGGVKSDIFRVLDEYSFCQKMCIYCCCGFCMCSVWNFAMKTIKEGAQTTLECCLVPYEKLESGAFYNACKVQNGTLGKEENWKPVA